VTEAILPPFIFYEWFGEDFQKRIILSENNSVIGWGVIEYNYKNDNM